MGSCSEGRRGAMRQNGPRVLAREPATARARQSIGPKADRLPGGAGAARGGGRGMGAAAGRGGS